MYTDFIVHVGMPEVILLNPRIPNPDTDKLLHGEERRENLTVGEPEGEPEGEPRGQGAPEPEDTTN